MMYTFTCVCACVLVCMCPCIHVCIQTGREAPRFHRMQMAAEEEQRQQRKAAAKRRFRLAGRKVQVQNILGTLGGGLSVKEAAQRLAAGNAFNARRGAGGLSPRTLAWNKLAPDAVLRRYVDDDEEEVGGGEGQRAWSVPPELWMGRVSPALDDELAPGGLCGGEGAAGSGGRPERGQGGLLPHKTHGRAAAPFALGFVVEDEEPEEAVTSADDVGGVSPAALHAQKPPQIPNEALDPGGGVTQTDDDVALQAGAAPQNPSQEHGGNASFAGAAVTSPGHMLRHADASFKHTCACGHTIEMDVELRACGHTYNTHAQESCT